MDQNKFTLVEVQQHNSSEDCWTVIDGKVYDVTTYLNRHPGGIRLAIQCAGRESSALFQSSHLSKKPLAVLQKFHIGYAEYPTPPLCDFYNDLHSAVSEALADKVQQPKPLRYKLYVHLLPVICVILSFFARIQGSYLVSFLLGFFDVCFPMHVHALAHMQIFDSVGYNEQAASFLKWFCFGAFYLGHFPPSTNPPEHITHHVALGDSFQADPDVFIFLPDVVSPFSLISSNGFGDAH